MDFIIQYYESLTSTNDEARNQLLKGAPEGVVIVAKTQTQGRGRQGRTWASPPGNLYLSIILRPRRPFTETALVSFIAPLAIDKALSRGTGENLETSYKWPNDVLVEGKKISGILLETDGAASPALVVGIGINLGTSVLLPYSKYRACTLQDYAARKLTCEEFLPFLLEAFKEYYTLWQEEGFLPIRTAWLRKAHGLKERLAVRVGSQFFEGVFEDIDEKGALLLRLSSGKVQRIITGDVFFPPEDNCSTNNVTYIRK